MTTVCKAFNLEKGGVVSLVGAGGKTSLMYRLAHEMSAAGGTVLTTTTTKIKMPHPEQSRHVFLTTSSAELIEKAGEMRLRCRHMTAAMPGQPEKSGKISGFTRTAIDEIERSGCFQWIVVEADGAAQKPLKVPAEHEPVIPGSSLWVVGVAGLSAVGKPLAPEWVFRHERFASITGLAQGQPISVGAVAAAVVHPSGIFKGTPSRARKILFLNAAGKADCIETGRRIAARILAFDQAHPIERIVIGSPQEEDAVAECHIGRHL